MAVFGIHYCQFTARNNGRTNNSFLMDQRTQHQSDLNFKENFILYADKITTYFLRHTLTLRCVWFDGAQIS
jgi:hypothetical protein